MQSLFANGAIADFILLLIGAEALGLIVLRALGVRVPKFADVAGTLAAGALLVLALKFALTGARWEFTATALAGAFAAHAVDLAMRWRR